MTGKLLDVSTMTTDQVYECEDGSKIYLGEFVNRHFYAVRALATNGLIKPNESFGFAMAAPMWDEDLDTLVERGDFWDHPEKFVWFVHGWGPDRDRYIANAVRKMRALLRPVVNDFDSTHVAFESTLDIRFNLPEHFRDKVESTDADGMFPWGDFPWGGAALVRMGGLTLCGGVSGYTEIEDDMIDRLILGGIGQRIVNGNRLLTD